MSWRWPLSGQRISFLFLLQFQARPCVLVLFFITPADLSFSYQISSFFSFSVFHPLSSAILFLTGQFSKGTVLLTRGTFSVDFLWKTRLSAFPPIHPARPTYQKYIGIGTSTSSVEERKCRGSDERKRDGEWCERFLMSVCPVSVFVYTLTPSGSSTLSPPVSWLPLFHPWSCARAPVTLIRPFGEWVEEGDEGGERRVTADTQTWSNEWGDSRGHRPLPILHCVRSRRLRETKQGVVSASHSISTSSTSLAAVQFYEAADWPPHIHTHTRCVGRLLALDRVASSRLPSSSSLLTSLLTQLLLFIPRLRAFPLFRFPFPSLVSSILGAPTFTTSFSFPTTLYTLIFHK